MPKSLAEARVKVTVLASLPDPLPSTGATIAVSVLNAGKDAQCALAKNGSRMSAAASDTIDDPALCDEGNKAVLGASNYEWSWTMFRYFDATTGLPHSTDDWLFAAVETKGATVIAAVRKNGNMHDDPWKVGEKGYLYIGVNDNPQEPQDLSGYQKQVVPFSDIRRVPFTVADDSSSSSGGDSSSSSG